MEIKNQSECPSHCQKAEIIRESEEQYRLIFEKSPLGILHFDLSGTILKCNSKFAEIIGISKEKLIGFNMLTSLKDKDLKSAVASSLSGQYGYYEGKYISVLANKTTFVKIIFSQITSDNGKFLGAVGIVEDITERKMAEEALRIIEARNQALINVMPDLMLVIKKDGTIVDFRAGQDFVILIPPHEFLGKNIVSLWHASLSQQTLHYIEQTLKTGHTQIFEYQLNIKGKPCIQEARLVISGENEVLVIIREITERKQMEHKLKYLGLHDSLTGLYNRAYFEQEMNRLSDESYAPVGIIVCDVDALKLVNDTLGHDNGDLLLINAADVLRRSFRSDDMIARIGGDEFAILLPNSNRLMVEKACQRIRKTVSNYNKENPLVLLNISVGYAVSNRKAVNLSELFKEADNNMYRLKLSSTISTRNAIMQTLLKGLEIKDFIFEGHTDRIQELVVAMADAIGLAESIIAELRIFARYHDIGKVGISDSILFKTTSLTPEEFAEIKRHCEIGHRIAQSTPDLLPVADWILKHHEWYNGKGYPLGLKGEDIPLECRILSIADAYDAMTNTRPYKEAKTHKEALKELRDCAGTQFDEELVKMFLRILGG